MWLGEVGMGQDSGEKKSASSDDRPIRSMASYFPTTVVSSSTAGRGVTFI
jgi:hypothetical protein